VIEAKHLPIQHNVVAVHTSRFAYHEKMQSDHQYHFSMCKYLDDYITDFIFHVAESKFDNLGSNYVACNIAQSKRKVIQR